MIIPLAPERTNAALDALASGPHCWLNIQPAAPPRPADLSLQSWCLTMHKPEWGAAWGYSTLGGWLCLWLCWSWVPHHPLPQSINSCPVWGHLQTWLISDKALEKLLKPYQLLYQIPLQMFACQAPNCWQKNFLTDLFTYLPHNLCPLKRVCWKDKVKPCCDTRNAAGCWSIGSFYSCPSTSL